MDIFSFFKDGGIKKPTPKARTRMKITALPKPKNMEQFKANQTAVDMALLLAGLGRPFKGVMIAAMAGLESTEAHMKDAIIIYLATACLTAISETQIQSTTVDGILRELGFSESMADESHKPVFDYLHRVCVCGEIKAEGDRMADTEKIGKRIDEIIATVYPTSKKKDDPAK